MHPQSIAPFVEYALTLSKYPARLVTSADGRGVLHCTVGSTSIRFQTTGRPDGVRPSGADSTLALLRIKIAAAQRIQPQDWMELDREFALYQHRGRSALGAAVEACRQGHFDQAIRLCRLSNDDTSHQLAIVALATEAHPSGGLPGAGAPPPTSLWVQQCVCDALPALIASGPAAAQSRLRRGVEEISRALGTSNDTAAGENNGVRRLATIAARLDADRPAAVAPSPAIALHP